MIREMYWGATSGVQLSLALFNLCVTVIICSKKQPNIVFILADDYGWNDIGYHGSEIRTPNLNKLASDGVKLENYYVQPICSPSRSQLMSGRYQIHTGLQHGVIRPCVPNGLPLDLPTLADKMKEQRYSTHMIGKWHLGFYKEDYVPTRRGFDTYLGYYTGAEDYYKHDREWLGISGVDFRDQTKPSNASYGNYSAFVFAERAKNVIKNQDKSKPMFMYMAFQSVHGPLQVPKPYEDMYANINNHRRRTFAGMVTVMDEAVGTIVKSLKDAGMWENTVLMFSTDNGGIPSGGGNNAPLRGQKATYWEGGVRGVGFVSSPLIKQSQRISKELMHITDWYPTIVHLARGSMNGTKSDGYNQWDTINIGSPSPRTEILHNIDPLTKRKGKSVSTIFDTAVQASLRTGDWKLLTGNPGYDQWVPEPTNESEEYQNLALNSSNNESSGDQNLWLFNIASDPEERSECSSKHPNIVTMMLKRLADYQKTAVPAVFPPDDPKCNPSLHGGFWGPWVN